MSDIAAPRHKDKLTLDVLLTYRAGSPAREEVNRKDGSSYSDQKPVRPESRANKLRIPTDAVDMGHPQRSQAALETLAQ